MNLRMPLRVALAASAALLAAGCSYVNPITTNETYAASDGLLIDIGDVRGANVLVVKADGGSAVVGTLFNRGTDDTTVSVAIEGVVVIVQVEAGDSVRLGFDEGDVPVVGGEVSTAGLLEPVTVTVGDETQTVATPIVDDTLPEYAGLVADLEAYLAAEAAAASPSPSASAEPSPSPSVSAAEE